MAAFCLILASFSVRGARGTHRTAVGRAACRRALLFPLGLFTETWSVKVSSWLCCRWHPSRPWVPSLPSRAGSHGGRGPLALPRTIGVLVAASWGVNLASWTIPDHRLNQGKFANSRLPRVSWVVCSLAALATRTPMPSRRGSISFTTFGCFGAVLGTNPDRRQCQQHPPSLFKGQRFLQLNDALNNAARKVPSPNLRKARVVVTC